MEIDLFFIHAPLSKAGIALGKKNNVQVNFLPLRQRIENGNAVGRDNLGDDDNSAVTIAAAPFPRGCAPARRMLPPTGGQSRPN